MDPKSCSPTSLNKIGDSNASDSAAKQPKVVHLSKRKCEQFSETRKDLVKMSSLYKKQRSAFASKKVRFNLEEDASEKTVLDPVMNVLGEIQEKNMTLTACLAPLKHAQKEGFPLPFVRDKRIEAKGKSIFAQQISKQRQEEEIKTAEDSNLNATNVEEVFGSKSYVLKGPESQELHRENLERLSKMSSKEIYAEQQTLLSKLDPKLVSFLRSRRKPNMETDSIENKSISNCQQKQETDVSTMEVDAAPESKESTEVTENSESEITSYNDVTEERTKDMDVENIPDSESSESKTEIPIASELANKWLHMDVVEHEKLQWVGEIPAPPKAPPDTPYSARFDFEGMLLPYQEEVDVRKALHHHGEEPERPGYTVQELLQLSRSSVLQQRVLALNTLASILDKTKAGYYDECLETPLLQQLVDADTYLLLRFSLDDNTDTVVTATLCAIRSLLWNQPDELCLDRLLGSCRGHWQPSLEVKMEKEESQDKKKEEEEEAELKDHQVLKLDILKGALRTDLIIRLRYILEVLKPGPKAVICALQILTRIARHSHDATLAVTCCPRLLQIIVSNFLPRDWAGIVGTVKPSDMVSVYGVPLVEALKLLRVIASRSRIMASDMVHKLRVMESVVSYISIDPRECGLPQQEALKLSLESFYLWKTLLGYNLATTHFIDLYPVLMRLLQFHLSATSVMDTTSSFGHEHGAALIDLINQAVLTAHAQSGHLASQKATGSNQQIVSTLSYYHLQGFMQPLYLCLKKWLSQLTRTEELSFSALKLLGTTLNCCAAQYLLFRNKPGLDGVSLLVDIEALVNSSLNPFLQSTNFRKICSRLKSCSALLSRKRDGTDRDPKSLPSLGSVIWGNMEVIPTIGPQSPFIFLQGLTYFIIAVSVMHRSCFAQNRLHLMLKNPQILDYLNQIGTRKLHHQSNWFICVETLLILHITRLAKIALYSADLENIGIFHSAALQLASLIPGYEKFHLQDVFSKVIFNPDFLRDCSDLAYSLESLQLKECPGEDAEDSIQTLLQCAIENIPNLWNFYQTNLGFYNATEPSAATISTVTASRDKMEPCFPSDWPFIPVLVLYNFTLSGKPETSENVKMVENALQWLLIVECLRPTAMGFISITAKFCRLATVFLAGSDLFLEPKIHSYLYGLLKILLRSNLHLDFNEKIPGLTSFYDLYTQLLEQFAAVSYGDELFGQFVLVPLQQHHSSRYRKLLWSEQAAVIRCLRVPVEKLAVPLQGFLEPCETDASLLMTYLRALATGQVREVWSPVLYRVALHHVGTFIAKHTDTTIAQQLRSRINQLGNKELRTLLLEYAAKANATGDG